MAYTNLTVLFTAIADAIRQKTGKSVLINPQDFPQEILNIPTGGGGTKYYILQTIVGDTCVLSISDTPTAGADEYNINVIVSGNTQILNITDSSGYSIIQTIVGDTCSLAITD